MNNLQRTSGSIAPGQEIADDARKSPVAVTTAAAAAAEGIEPILTVKEAAVALRWSYDTVRRYFKDQPGVLVRYQPKRYKRPYKAYMIPRSVFQREWNRMAGFNAANTNSRGVR